MKIYPAVLVGFAAFIANAGAQNAPKAQPPKAVKWFEDQRNYETGIAVQLTTANHPFMTAFVRYYSLKELVWKELTLVNDTAPKLNPNWLRRVRDRGPIPAVGLVKDPNDYPANYKAYVQAVVNSIKTPVDAFKKSAEENKEVQFAHLYGDRLREYRGKVVKITGNLRRLREFSAPDYIKQLTLVEKIYEGWIYGPTRGAYPYCVQFITKPDSVKLGENIDYHVDFYGYVFKLYRYVDASHKVRDTPLLIGPTLIVTPPPVVAKKDGPGFPVQMLIAIVAFTAAVAALIGVMSFLYRRGDRRVREQIANTKAARAIDMIEQEAGISAGDPPHHDGMIAEEDLPNNRLWNEDAQTESDKKDRNDET